MYFLTLKIEENDWHSRNIIRLLKELYNLKKKGKKRKKQILGLNGEEIINPRTKYKPVCEVSY